MTHATNFDPSSIGDDGAPLLGAPLWRQVMARAGDRCECQGGCGRKHKDGKGRCVRENAPARPLYAVPRQILPWSVTVTLPAGELEALCEACHSLTDRARRAAHLAQLAEANATDSLF